MNAKIAHELAEELRDVQEQIRDLLNEAKSILRRADRSIRQRAEGYWLAQLTMALDNNHGYLGRAGATMESTIDELADFEDDA